MNEANPAATAAVAAAAYDTEAASPGSIKAVVTSDEAYGIRDAAAVNLDISMSDVPLSASGAAILSNINEKSSDLDAGDIDVSKVDNEHKSSKPGGIGNCLLQFSRPYLSRFPN